MPLSNMSEFLEGLYNSRLLDHAQIEELLHQPETPSGDIPGVSRFLQSKGWLTEFQINQILDGRGDSLFFASYRLLDSLGNSPAGTRYKVYHPALQKPVALTLFRPEWVSPGDSLPAYLERLQKVSTVSHANLVNILDAGTMQGVSFLLEELCDGTDLGFFVNEMGALPSQLGIDFVKQTCLGLQAIHDLGLCHGDLHPGQLILSPVIRSTFPDNQIAVRPAPGAAIKVQGSAFTPLRPPVNELTVKQSGLLKTIDFLAPERLNQNEPTKRGDLYSLGACFYFLLVGRAPHRSTNEAEAIWNLQYGKITPILELRSDVPPSISNLIGRLLSRNPADRPASLFEVLTQMQSSNWAIPAAPRVEQTVAIPQATETASFPSSLKEIMQEHNALPGSLAVAFPAPVASVPTSFPPSFPPSMPRPMVEPMDSSHRLGEPYQPRPRAELAPTVEPIEELGDIFGDHSTDEHDPAPTPRGSKPQKKPTSWLWIILLIIFGLSLHGIGLWFWFGGDSNSTPPPTKNEVPKESDKSKKKKSQ